MEGRTEQEVALLGFSSGILRRVVPSSFTGELLQQYVSFDRARWTALLLEEATGRAVNVHMRTDCFGLISTMNSLRLKIQEQRFAVEVWALKEAFELHEISTFEHVPGLPHLMVADGMTKYTPRGRDTVARAMEGYVRLPTLSDRKREEAQGNKHKVWRSKRWREDEEEKTHLKRRKANLEVHREEHGREMDPDVMQRPEEAAAAVRKEERKSPHRTCGRSLPPGRPCEDPEKGTSEKGSPGRAPSCEE